MNDHDEKYLKIFPHCRSVQAIFQRLEQVEIPGSRYPTSSRCMVATSSIHGLGWTRLWSTLRTRPQAV